MTIHELAVVNSNQFLLYIWKCTEFKCNGQGEVLRNEIELLQY